MDTDVVVIGGNPGGCSAAIAAARSGLSVVILEPTKTLGGINANGVFGFDSATPEAISGIATEVEKRVQDHYKTIGLDDPLFTGRADQVWESHVAAKVWHDIVDETDGLTALTGAVPVGVVKEGRRIVEVQWQPAVDNFGNIDASSADVRSIRAHTFIDASYEGDVIAWAGVPHRLGREARSATEPHAGKMYTTNMEYARDGWMPQTILPNSAGEADDGIMAFACRLHCRFYEDTSEEAEHRIKSPPPGYDPSYYSWLPVGEDEDGNPIYFNTLYVLVNNKFLVNRMVRGNNLTGPNREYILAHPRDRKPLRQRFYDHALGYLYYIQTEGRTPQLGLANDEFQDNGFLPYQLYIREARRIEGDVLLTEADISPYVRGNGFRPPRKHDAVAMGDWMMESHGCTDTIEPGYPNPEGFFYNRASRAPYQVPYGILIPKEADNLIVSGCVSATHIAFSAVRCEAVRIQVGIAAGVAAGLSRSLGCLPVDVPVALIQDELIERGGKLTYLKDVEATHPQFAGIQWAALRGFVPEDERWRFFPDNPVSWAEFAKAIVLCLALPISVSGQHFEGVDLRHPSLRYLETLYDLGTRADVDLFESKKLFDEDPMEAILRLRTGPRLIPFLADAPLSTNAALSFLARVATILDSTVHAGEPTRKADRSLLTRGELCTLLRQIDKGRRSGS